MAAGGYFCASILVTLIMTCKPSVNGQCINPSDITRNLSCDFSTNTCGWNRTEAGLEWKIESQMAVLRMMMEAKGSKAKLQSPWVCMTSSADFQSLKMYITYKIVYYHQQPVCQLYVARENVSENEDELWTENNTTNGMCEQNVSIPNSGDQFRLYIQGEKLIQAPRYCSIEVYNISFSVPAPSPSVPATTSLGPTASQGSHSAASQQTTSQNTSPTTMQTFSSTPNVTLSTTSLSATPQTSATLSTPKPQGIKEQSGLSDGEISAVVIGLIVLCIVVVLFILVLRRRASDGDNDSLWVIKCLRRKSKNTGSRSPTATREASSTAHTTGDEFFPVHHHPNKLPLQSSRDLHCGLVSERDRVTGVKHNQQQLTEQSVVSSDYEIADIPESSNYYSVPIGEVCPSNLKKTQGPDYELAAIVESGGDYSTVDDADLEERRARARPDEYAKVKKPKEGNYNKLSFQNPGFDGKAEDTYNHIEDEEPVYKVPRSDGNEYSLATNPGASSVGRSAGGSSEPHYVIVDGKGKDDAARGGDDEYYHLNLRKEPSANVPDSTDRGTGTGVYNHLDDQNQGPPGVQTEDTYNRVNYDGHTQDQNRKQNAGNYSHIGGF